MAKIHILESNVYNQIAAGEVIESTASVIKELVENAIDAKATEITIKIERGGKECMQVSDNGCGIEESELPAAFLPHATSKIQVAKDLESITTLGFRGEAVASIASVAKVQIRSKFVESELAYSLSCDGGTMGEVQPTALPCGTEITVQHLFYNTPVRAKFLKTDRGEESEITACITKFMLGNPDIAFLYQVDGKTKLRSYGGGLQDVMLAIYGKDILSNCIAIDATKNNLRIRGYIGKPSFTKANRTYQTTFINGRYVVNSTVQMAVHKAYESYIMKRQYPFYMLSIDMPTEEVDVNVHPRKTDVRFANNSLIFSSIHKVVSAVLDGTADAVDFLADDMLTDINPPYLQAEQTPQQKGTAKAQTSQQEVALQEHTTTQPTFTETATKKAEEIAASIHVNRQESTATIDRQNTDTIQPKEQIYTFDALDKVNQKYDNMQKDSSLQNLFAKLSEKEGEKLTFQDSASESVLADSTNTVFASTLLQNLPEQSEQPSKSIVEPAFDERKAQLVEQQKIFMQQASYIGSIFQTYLLYSLENAFYIIDQHAAHERLLYDKLCKKMKAREIYAQSMLVPYLVQVNTEESFFIEENLTALQELGFEISRFGENTYRVESVASDLYDIDLKKFFTELFNGLGQFKGIQFVDIFKEKLAMMACKAAVKGGQQLTPTEVDRLFDMLAGDIGLKCPHGRPIAIRFSKTEIEKLFKRIV